MKVGSILRKAWRLVEEHKVMLDMFHRDAGHPHVASLDRSNPPLDILYKINIDVADPKDDVWGIGTIIRDAEDVVLVAATWKTNTFLDSDVAEAMRFKLAIQFN